MAGPSALCEKRHALLRNNLAIAALVAALSLIPAAALARSAAPAAAPAPANAISLGDQHCLSCHGFAGMTKKLEDGDTLQLHVPGGPFEKSVHHSIGCTGCHANIDPAKHPPATPNKIQSIRSFAVTTTQLCRNCHANMFEQWQTSVHAALVRSGNPLAPICTDCHNPHSVIKGAAATIDQIPCKKCHSEIYTAYLGSVHGQSRLHSKTSYAPLCSGCHTAHAVKPTAIGTLAQGPEGACLGCHAGVLQAHQQWLPNAALHFQVVSCPACHVPNAQRKVDLMLIDAKNAKARGTEQIGVPLFEASARSNGQGIDAQSLWKLLQTLNRSGITDKTVVRGRLEVANGPQMHEIAPKSKAISDCRTCHNAGSKAFQSVTISLVGPSGRRVGYGANANVLNSVISLDSVQGFYAIGGTRIKLLDILLILAIVGGLGIAVGHVALGWIFRFYGFYHPRGGPGGHGGSAGNGRGPKAK
jgi:hypothetical protein